MKTSIRIKTLLLLIVLVHFGKTGYSQEKPKVEKQPELTLPDSYYKARAEKIKYAETHKVGAVSTETASTFYPQKAQKKQTQSPELSAKEMLNTTEIPVDFPLYNASSSTPKEYETKVAAWFKKNPSFRKINK